MHHIIGSSPLTLNRGEPNYLMEVPPTMSAQTVFATIDTPASTTRLSSLPTAPCSVVWSGGHAFVLEQGFGRSRWAGVDDRGRAQLLTNADLQRQGWSTRRD
ncbi:hypothetical protein GCM10010452_67100 [Crossiella cryophila]